MSHIRREGSIARCDLTADELNEILNAFDRGDLVPVVRCKDCKNLCKVESFTWLAGECEITHNKVTADFFCAFGQRKDGDG